MKVKDWPIGITKKQRIGGARSFIRITKDLSQGSFACVHIVARASRDFVPEIRVAAMHPVLTALYAIPALGKQAAWH